MNDFVYDPNLDWTWAEYRSYMWWRTKLLGAMVLRWDLYDATRAYKHYGDGNGVDLEIDYTKAYDEDAIVKKGVDADIDAAKSDAEKLWDGKAKTFEITGQAVRQGDPSTENWQKTIGHHWLWGSGSVKTCVDGDPNEFEMTITIHEKDRYNFNRNAADIATGAPDNGNGRFEELGWANSFITNGTVVKTVRWRKSGAPPPTGGGGGGGGGGR